MATFAALVQDIKNLSDYSERTKLLSFILNVLQNKKTKLSADDKTELLDFTFSEIKELLSLIPTLKTYQEKDAVFGYEDALLGIVMLTHKSPDQIPQSHFNNIQALLALVNKERFVENAIDEIFQKKANAPIDVERLICQIAPLKDEFQKGQLFQGLLHYQQNMKELPDDSKKLLADYIASEIARYLDEPLTETIINNLEFACDVAKHFINDTLISLLYEVCKKNKNNINFYATETLLHAGKPLPENVITSLAHDLVYADLTYSLLQRYGLTSAFPSELANEEYLAKSDLIHWLNYPTELGQQPDRIEFLGKVKKKEEYFVFRYMSDSDNLSEDLRGQWLIGWSNRDGGTFSNFDLYSDFEQKTLEKTLKKIRKIL